MTLRDQLVRDEGRRLKPYRDQLGILTIGVGRNLEANGISYDECDLMLDNDIARFEAAVRVRLPWSGCLTAPRHAVLVGMAFNMGVGGLLAFRRMLTACEHGDYAEAAREMLDSRWAGQVGDRAQRLAQQMESGEWR